MSNNKYFEINVAALLVDLGLDEMPDAEKMKVAELVQGNILGKLLVHLTSIVETEEERKMLNDAAEFPEIVIEYFAKKKDVNFPALIIQFTHEVREELLQDVAFLQGAISASQAKEA
jgi:hypothetical protein